MDFFALVFFRMPRVLTLLLLCSSAASIGGDDAEAGHQMKAGFGWTEQRLKGLIIIEGLGKDGVERRAEERTQSAGGGPGAVILKHKCDHRVCVYVGFSKSAVEETGNYVSKGIKARTLSI